MSDTEGNKNSIKLIKPIKKISQAWDCFWFSDIKPHPINAFRILFGIYLLIYFLRYFPHVDVLFSNQGVYSPFWIPDLAPDPVIAWIVYLITLCTIVLFTLGFRTGITTPLLLIFFIYHFFLNFAVKNCSYDRLIIIFLVLLSLGKINSVWNIESKLNKNPENKKDNSPQP
ncbi:MAG: hypothetical protein SFU25_01045, partial [Candidatus Caenarcaniphilales bacterium]|nr:hypothetical protein [Candidatus Caenarcaniphilales bacterium]